MGWRHLQRRRVNLRDVGVATVRASKRPRSRRWALGSATNGNFALLRRHLPDRSAFGAFGQYVRPRMRRTGRMQTLPASPLPVPGAARTMSSLPCGGWRPPVCLHQGAPQPSLPVAFDPGPSHAGAGGARNRAISTGISLNICRDTATSANWKVTQGPWLMLWRRS
jgi:hypothetical protein